MSDKLIYDSDDLTPSAAKRVVTVNDDPVIIRAAGLPAGTCLPVYQRVVSRDSSAAGCGCSATEDAVWQPVISCGEALEICDTNNLVALYVPGQYSIGDPTVEDLALVNTSIVAESPDGLTLEVAATLGKLGSATAGGDDGSASTSYVHTECMIDDVNGDGSLLVPYVVVTYVSVDSEGMSVSVPIGEFTDGTLATPYTVQGTGVPAGEIGSEPVVQQLRRQVSGGTWSPTGLTESYTIRVVSGSGSTFTDSSGTVTPLVENEVVTYERQGASFDTNPVLTVPVGESAIVTYIELGV